MKTQEKTPGVLEVIDFCRQHGFEAELVGKWVWVRFDKRPDQATRRALKDIGFRWSKRRGRWAHNCGHPTKSARESDPWQKYHTRIVSRKGGAA
ncbi:hypothetical protein STSP2_03296 [Anaerohalosphaera lusitana]|uniref:Uncharacterized protein n=1 Tax=Anaerohalosphaera lusitana TaxID=1936003 RepID=A0A1U9NQT2_9BACT|nr:hypothetical protein [Anaerohalosphaera lusitana]AQT70094.1 hypothetical protein STSP2_03296 [Anaerohalosphaera lusitana]